MIRRGARAQLAMLVAAACAQPPAEDCHGVCGAGTRCQAGQCVVAQPAAPPVADEPAPATKEKRRGRGRSRAAEGDSGAPAADAEPLEDDSSVPSYDRDAEQVIDMKAGSERLADATVQSHMRQLEPQFDRCIAAAVGRGAEIAPGKVDFAFAVEPSGKVGGVDVRAPAAMRDAGVVPCLRKVVHGHRFPTWDGPRADVEYTFRVE